MRLTASVLAVALCLGLAGAVGAQPKPSYADVTKATVTVADAYVAAYTSLNWDGLAPLLGEEASFQDRTAELVFGPVQAQGRPAMLSFFKENYASITKMAFQQVRAIHSGHYGIYEGSLTWALKMPDGKIVENTAPFVVTVRVEDGKVVEHRDYVDYAPFLAAVRQSRGAGK